MLFLFSAAIILIKLPPFYLFSQLPSTAFTSHVLAKVLLLFITFFLVKIYWQQLTQHKVAILVVFIFFLSQSAAVFGAQQLVFFWKQYQNVITAVLIFFSSCFFTREKRLTWWFSLIYAIGVGVVIAELLFLLFTDSVSSYMPLTWSMAGTISS